MATPVRSVDPRERILKCGFMKHRQTGIGLHWWRPRYVVFKITNSGRLQLVVYKEQPATTDNEVKHVSIEEYGGIENNLRLESELYTFAIITTSATDCFSTETPQELTDWTNLIQEYLGKEMVLNITIPFHQSVLRKGKANLRIRNTGFTITSCENPPRVQGTWQIIHIRKYGGSETFKFQTGSKCPSGEHLYTIQTDNNQRIKSLFNDLSQHKPIFTDDRVGRRMTLERSFNGKANTIPGTHPGNRHSLQNTSTKDPDTHLYENRDTLNGHQSIPEPSMNHTERRHSAAAGVEVNNSSNRLASTSSTDDVSSRQYQNVNRHSSHQGRLSPTKRVHHHVPVPEDYYSVTPPQVVQQQRYRSSNTTPCSSPEDDNWLSEQFLQTSNEDYSNVTPARVSSLIGDHLVFHEESTQQDSIDQGTGNFSGQYEGGQYQNLKFLKRGHTSGTVVDNVSRPPRPTESQNQVAYAPQTSVVSTSDQEWAPHNYTNVQLAVEAVHGKVHKKMPSTSPSVFPPDPKPRAKVSTLSYSGENRDVYGTPSKHSAHNDSLGGAKSLSIPPISYLRTSRSNFELNKQPTESSHLQVARVNNLPDYYNIFVPELPANSVDKQRFIELKQFPSSQVSGKQHNVLGNNTDTTHVSEYTDSPGELADIEFSVNDKQASGYTEYPVIVTTDKRSKSPALGNYDTLKPLVSKDDKNEHSEPHYDSLLPLNLDSNSGSSSPEPLTSPPDSFSMVSRYDRKIQITQHPHKYEYIDIDITHSGESTSSEGVFSPSNSVEHPLAWMSPHPPDSTLIAENKRRPTKESKTRPRRKHLPLQMCEDIVEDTNGLKHSGMNVSALKPRGPRMSRIPLKSADSLTLNESSKHLNKPLPLPRLSTNSQDTSHGVNTSNRHSASSDDSVSSFDLIRSVSTTYKDTLRDCVSPSNRQSHDDVSPRISSIHVELVGTSEHPDTVPPPVPPRRHADDNSDNSKGTEPFSRGVATSDTGNSSHKETPPLPPRPQEGIFKVPLPQAHFDFQKTATPPKPKVLKVLSVNEHQPSNYVALTFGSQEDSNDYTEVDLIQQTSTVIPVDQADSRVPYVSVSFLMTDALRNTKEQVDDKKREFISATQKF